MKALVHGVATVAVVLTTAFCVLVQVADLDDAIDGIDGRPGVAAGQ